MSKGMLSEAVDYMEEGKVYALGSQGFRVASCAASFIEKA